MPNQRNATGKPKIISRCKAIYSYTPKLSDELRINPGSYRFYSIPSDNNLFGDLLSNG